MKVRKAVITAAGWGTRFLPITKSQPKEMLPLVDKPVIQYAVDEAIASGIEQIIVVTAQGKHSIEDYFDHSWELEQYLEQRGETGLLNQVLQVSEMADICYIRQKTQLGLGHAVLTARDMVADEPFALILPDDVCLGKEPLLKQMLEVYDAHESSIIAVREVSQEETGRFGIIRPKKMADRLYKILGLVEKPPAGEAPSNLAIVGRYILKPQVFDELKATPPGRNGEIQLTDGLQRLLKKQPIYGYQFEGSLYDTGTPQEWLKSNVRLALNHPQMGPAFKDYLRQLTEREP